MNKGVVVDGGCELLKKVVRATLTYMKFCHSLFLNPDSRIIREMEAQGVRPGEVFLFVQ